LLLGIFSGAEKWIFERVHQRWGVFEGRGGPGRAGARAILPRKKIQVESSKMLLFSWG